MSKDISIDNFDAWELGKVCNFLAEHNPMTFSSPEKVKAEIFSRAQELRIGEFMATCGFLIIKVRERAIGGILTGSCFYKVSIDTCVLPSRFNPGESWKRG